MSDTGYAVPPTSGGGGRGTTIGQPSDGETLAQFIEDLRLYLFGEAHVTGMLYELIFNHTTQVVFRPLDAEPQAARTDAAPAAVRTAKELSFGRHRRARAGRRSSTMQSPG